MRAGAASVDITPEIGCELSGYVAREQPSVGLHSRLYARALYIEHNTSCILWLHADIIGYNTDDASSLRREISSKLQMPIDAVVLSATHTHAGPATLRLLNCGTYDPAYVAHLGNCLVELAYEAKSKLESIQLVFGEGHNDLSIDRRGKPSAHVDHRIGVIGFQRNDGSYTALLANYPIHNVALGSENRYISGDLFGCAAKTLHDTLPGNPVVLFTNGACGNMNPPDHVTDFSILESWGTTLAESVLDILTQAESVTEPALLHRCSHITLPLDSHTPEWIDHWVEKLVAETGTSGGYVADRVHDAASQWKIQMLALYGSGKVQTNLPFEIQLLKIGPVRLICLGAEVFSRFTDELRQVIPGPLFLVGYANGDFGYLPTPEAFNEGGYETDNAFIFYGGYRPAPEAYNVLMQSVLSLLSSSPTNSFISPYL